MAQVDIGHQFIDHHLGAHQFSGSPGLAPGNPHEPHDRRADDSQDSLKRQGAGAAGGEDAQHQVRQVDEGYHDQEHGYDVYQKLNAPERALGDGVHGTADRLGFDQIPRGSLTGLRNHDLGDDHGGHGVEEGSRQDVPDDVGNDLGQDAGIEHHDGAGDGRHPTGHDREQLAAGHSAQVGSDEERSLHHS